MDIWTTRPQHRELHALLFTMGSLTSPASHYSKDAGDGAYGLSEKTRISNHLQMSLQRQHILLSYFKTLSVGPVWGSNPRPPAR